MLRKLLAVVGLVLCFMTISSIPTHTEAAATRKSQTVTLYLHGHRGNPKSMAPLMESAVFEKHAHTGVTAFVANNGKVTLKGHWPAHTKRPLVNVIFKNNRTHSYYKISHWFRNVLIALKHKYGFKRFNVVAHSLGNAAVLFDELKFSRDKKLPQLKKYVAIAGNFDGVPGVHKDQHPNQLLTSGRPKWLAPKYRWALAHRQNLRIRQARILNIYGRLNRHVHFDGKILNPSSRSLGYLVRNRVKSYRERRFTGWDAEHTRLRTNPNVARAVNGFIW